MKDQKRRSIWGTVADKQLQHEQGCPVVKRKQILPTICFAGESSYLIFLFRNVATTASRFNSSRMDILRFACDSCHLQYHPVAYGGSTIPKAGTIIVPQRRSASCTVVGKCSFDSWKRERQNARSYQDDDEGACVIYGDNERLFCFFFICDCLRTSYVSSHSRWRRCQRVDASARNATSTCFVNPNGARSASEIQSESGGEVPQW